MEAVPHPLSSSPSSVLLPFILLTKTSEAAESFRTLHPFCLPFHYAVSLVSGFLFLSYPFLGFFLFELPFVPLSPFAPLFPRLSFSFASYTSSKSTPFRHTDARLQQNALFPLPRFSSSHSIDLRFGTPSLCVDP